MLDILGYRFFQNALLGVLIAGVAAAIVGTYIVARRMVFIAGGVTPACLGGLVLGYFLGVSPIAMASVFAVASSLGVEWLSTRQHVRRDSAIAVIWALGMALGTLFIFLTPGYVPELNSFLFGNILTITTSDLLAFGAFLVVLLAFFGLFYRTIIACAFDPDFARTMNLPVTAVNCTMTVLTALCIVLTIRLIGIMLLLSLFTMPQMTAENFTRNFRPMALISVAASVVCSVAGLVASYVLNVPASATIVIMLVVAYTVARLIGNKKRKSALMI